MRGPTPGGDRQQDRVEIQERHGQMAGTIRRALDASGPLSGESTFVAGLARGEGESEMPFNSCKQHRYHSSHEQRRTQGVDPNWTARESSALRFIQCAESATSPSQCPPAVCACSASEHTGCLHCAHEADGPDDTT